MSIVHEYSLKHQDEIIQDKSELSSEMPILEYVYNWLSGILDCISGLALIDIGNLPTLQERA